MERLTTHDQKDALGFLRDAYGLREFEQLSSSRFMVFRR